MTDEVDRQAAEGRMMACSRYLGRELSELFH